MQINLSGAGQKEMFLCMFVAMEKGLDDERLKGCQQVRVRVEDDPRGDGRQQNQHRKRWQGIVISKQDLKHESNILKT